MFDPRECEAARLCLEASNPQEAAKLLLKSPHPQHRAVRRLLLECGASLAAQARQAFAQGEVTAAENVLGLARRCADLTGDAVVLDNQIARARRNAVAPMPSPVPLIDRDTPFALRGRALVVSSSVVMLGSVRNREAHVPLLGRMHREHATISRHDGKYWIARAPHHLALVAVNGCNIQTPCELEHRDRIMIGGHDRRGACEMTFLRPDRSSSTAVLRQEKRWIVAPSGDSFEYAALLGDYLTVGRSETAHLRSPRLACEEIRLAWSAAGLTASAAGGAVYEESPDGEWRDLPTPLANPSRLVAYSDEDQAQLIFEDYQKGGEVDEHLELFDPRLRR